MSYQRADDDLEAYIRDHVAAGFETPASIAGSAAALYEQDEEMVARLTETAIARHEQEQHSWPAVTDCDRIDRAFSALDASGLLARQHFACCNRCGHVEMMDLAHTERERGRAIDGYVFYHWQDTDRVVTGGPLHVRYEAMSDSPGAKAAVGKRVVEALAAEGLSVTWSGDSEETIQLSSVVWQRRAAPIVDKKTWTPSSVLKLWCRRLPVADAADYSRLLGELYPEAAVSAGCIDQALAWARAASPKNVLGAATRARALSLVARALRNHEIAPERLDDLLLEAYAAAPYGRHGDLVDLLAGGDLERPSIREAARARVTQTRRDSFGAAAIAWYLVRASATQAEQTYHDALLEDVQDVFDSPSGAHLDENDARAAIAAALWVLRTRRGESEQAGAARAEAFELSSGSILLLFPQRCVLAAAVELGALADIAALVSELARAPWAELAAALARTGQTEAITGLLEAETAPRWLAARIARLLPDDVRASGWIEKADVGEQQLAALHEDGLLTDEEVRDTRLELASWHGSRGDVERARAELARVTEACRDELNAAWEPVAAHLRAVADGTCGPEPDADPSWLDAAGAERLERALTRWDAATDMRSALRARRAGKTILQAAAAIARHGDPLRGRALIDRALRNGMEAWVQKAALIAALVATDQLDLALARLDGIIESAETIAPIAARLGVLGKTSAALELLGPALDRAERRDELHVLAPAVLAVAPDATSAAREMLAAWQRGSERLRSDHQAGAPNASML